MCGGNRPWGARDSTEVSQYKLSQVLFLSKAPWYFPSIPDLLSPIWPTGCVPGAQSLLSPSILGFLWH